MNNYFNPAENLLSSRLSLLGFVNQSQIGIALIGSDLQFLDINEAFCRFLGYSIDELRDLTLRDVTLPNFIEQDEIYIHK